MRISCMGTPNKKRFRSVPLTGIITTIIIPILVGSCLLGTDTSLCETTGLHCREGQTCAPQQNVCVDIGGCGDGIRNEGELCDDGNLIDGDGCDSNCTPTGCGNGIVTVDETCDDGNDQACGTCSAECDYYLGGPARGIIALNSFMQTNNLEFKWFEISDSNISLRFEYVLSAPPSAGAVPIQLSYDLYEFGRIARTTASEIGKRLNIVATPSDNVIYLANKLSGVIGNVKMSKADGDMLIVEGMNGGLSGDCQPGVGCRSNADCLSNNCGINNVCVSK